ncbi:MAG: hypothetical protein KDA89_21290, partial [Planctomycetaceae bacterium]|nr:hypothetical protein [Planctomycetaceae bacterium]
MPRFSPRSRLSRPLVYLLIAAMVTGDLTGCSRRFWRQQANKDTYRATAQKLTDPHWQLPRIDITPDSRSRFFDPYDPDCEPLPPDDPAAHEFMHCVDGKRGYKSWHKFGTALSVENPQWLEPFGVMAANGQPQISHDQVVIENATLQDTLELSYIHSREYQTAIEDLYLAALQLTFERFQFGVRYLNSAGREPGVGYTGVSTFGAANTNGTLNSNFGISQLLPSGAQLAVEITNSTLWLFGTGGGSNTASTLSFNAIQPLLFQAGRKVVLAALTQAERNVLYQARTLARFRQILFTNITTAYLNLLQQQQTIVNNENNIRQIEEQIEAQQAIDNRVPSIVSEPLDALPEGFEIPDDLADHLSFRDGFLKWTGQLTDEQAERLESLTE